MKELPANFWGEATAGNGLLAGCWSMFYRITGPICKSVDQRISLYEFEQPFLCPGKKGKAILPY